jgi:hypothetical protein
MTITVGHRLGLTASSARAVVALMGSGRRAELGRARAMAGAVLCVLLLCAVGSERARASAGCSSSSSSSIGLQGGARLLSETDVPVCATGQVEVSFRSDAVTQCACGYIGTDTWQPQGGGDLDVLAYRRGGRRQFDTTLQLGGAISVRDAVQRTQATGRVSACSDTNDPQYGGFLSPPVRAGRLVVSLAQSGASLIDTRCAGPLPVDVGSALPTASISLSRIIHGGGILDLRGSHSFAAHGFSGVVRSTLVLRLGRPRANHPSRSVPVPSGPGRGKRIRSIVVTYHVERLWGSAVADVRALADPGECSPFDACGLSGTITTAPGVAHGGSISLFASAFANRPRRDLLAAVGLGTHGNPAGIGVGGGGDVSLRGTVAADLSQDGECRDHTRLSAASVQVQSRVGHVLISLSTVSTQATDPLRTRCPGPELGQHALVVSTLTHSALRGRLVIVALHGNSFSDGPYRVRTRSTLALTLRRVRVAVQTFRAPSPPS